jgi:hypothetical protein
MSTFLNSNHAEKFIHKWLARLLIGFSSLGLAGFSCVAFSAYQYTYTGNTYTGTLSQYEFNAPEPYISTKPISGEIFLQFTSPTLLTGAIDLDDIDGFTMAGEKNPNYETYPEVKGALAYPGPFQNPTYQTSAEFNIFSVDANGLPTNWDISISGNLGYTRHTYPNFSSTASSDQIYGYSEYGYEWSAMLNNNPGQWNVTSVVPEPETYALLLAGLGIVGFVYKRRRPYL